MEYSPTDEQRAIIESRLLRSVVTASAGAGKTGVIVNHFRALVLEDELQPDQILAITFTRKAAAEMKTRIVRDLRVANRLDLAQKAETGPIQTIHAFCQRLLTENSIAAGIDPDFDIASEGDKRRWQEEAIRETLAEDFDESPEVALVLQELAGRRANESGLVGMSPYGQIESALRTLLSQMRGSGIERREIDQRHSSAPRVIHAWQTAVLAPLPPEIATRATIGMPSAEFFAALAEGYRAAKISMPSYVKMVSDRDERDAEITSGLVQLACRAWQKLDGKMRQRSALDFNLLEELAIKALETETIRARIAGQYKVALIDEAQDLNPQQHRLIDRLEIERIMLVGDRQQSIYAFRQADVEHFIRRESEAGDRGDGSHKTLTKNHRSVAGLLHFVDAIFKPLWATYRPMAPAVAPVESDDNVIELFGPDPGEVDFEGVELWPMELADATDVARRIQDLLKQLPAGLTAKDVCVLVRDSNFGERLFRALDRRRVPAKLVGVSKQYYTRMEVRDIANALRALADPYDDFALAATLVSPFGGLSYDALAAFREGDEPGPIRDRLGQVQLDEGDSSKLSAFLAWYEPLTQVADRMTAGEAVTALLGETRYLESLATRPNGQQIIANVRKLLRIACDSEETSPLEFAEQIRETQTLRHDESDAPTQDEDSDAVSIMTIHRSKGLEFEVVVVPQTTSRIGRIRDEDVRFDPRVGVAAASFGVPRSRYFLWLQELRRQRETEEDWRVVYVALTRAKKRLCVVTRPSGAHTVADVIAKHSGFKEGTPPGVLIRE